MKIPDMVLVISEKTPQMICAINIIWLKLAGYLDDVGGGEL